MDFDFDPIPLLQTLYSAVLADVLDAMGLRRQCLGGAIRPLTATGHICGRAFTAFSQAVDEIPVEPYRLEMEAIDRMKRDDVFVVEAGHNTHSAFWGELLSTACQAKGVRGIVMNACTRDLSAIARMGFPVFGIGTTPADSKGRQDVVHIGQSITLDGVVIQTGDYILGDLDGVVVVPREAAPEALRRAIEKASKETTVRAELSAGVPVAEVFAKHGIL